MLILVAVEDCGDGEACDDVPDAPPGGDDEHASVRGEVGEDGGAEHQGEAKAGVLDAGFYGEGPAVATGDFEDCAYAVSYAECKQVVDKHHYEYVLDALQECLHVAAERQDHHSDEEDDAYPLQGLLEGVSHLGQELRGEDAEREGNAQKDEY